MSDHNDSIEICQFPYPTSTSAWGQMAERTSSRRSELPLPPQYLPDDVPTDEPRTAQANESFDTPTHQVKKGKRDTWNLELFSLSVGTVLICALAYILYKLNGYPMSIWNISITPSACISIIIAISEACTGVAVGSSLGQLKWIKYRQASRSLSEMQAFDDASRKSLAGSFRIVTGRGGYVL